MPDHKNISCVDLGSLDSLTSDSSEPGQQYTHCITDTGMLVIFNSERILERWVDLKMDHGSCIDISPSLIVCGGSTGIVRLFEPGTLKFIGTLPRPDPLFTDFATGKISDGFSNRELMLPDVVSVRKVDAFIAVLYSNKQLIIWDAKEVKQAARRASYMLHSDCIWGVQVMSNLS